ncbi:MAG: LamG-like jellyroll fold domain-containing protein [Candidatus Thorarchaeota archaeon]
MTGLAAAMLSTLFIMPSDLQLGPNGEPIAVAQGYGYGAPHVGGINWVPSGIAGVAATDYTSSLVAGWDLEEASGARDALWGTCGNDCDLTDNNTVGQDATNYVEGSASADFVAANNESLSCTNVTCDELKVATTFTAGCWVRDTGDAAASRIIRMFTSAGSHGYRLSRNATNDSFSCTIGDGTDTQSQDSSNNSLPVNTFTHSVCVADDSEILPYINGALNGCTAGGTCQDQNGPDGASSSTFVLSDDIAAFDLQGQLDECFVDDAAWTAAQVCFACSCELDGKLCMCDGSDPTSYKSCTIDSDCQVVGNTTALCNGGTCVGRNNTEAINCGSCTMPNCNASAP